MSENKRKICKHCKMEIDKKAKRCPHCGGKQRGMLNTLGIIVAVIFLLIVFISMFGGSSTPYSDEIQTALNMEESEFNDTCISVTYDELKRNPDNYSGKAIKITAEVAQIVSQSGGMMRGYGDEMYKEEYVLYDCRKEGSENIIEDDKIVAYGIYGGLKTIQRAIGGNDDVPALYIVNAVIKK